MKRKEWCIHEVSCVTNCVHHLFAYDASTRIGRRVTKGDDDRTVRHLFRVKRDFGPLACMPLLEK